MSKHFVILLFLQFSILFINAQQTSFSGKIIDNTSQKPIYNAVVILISAKDSSIQSFVRTKVDGTFIIKYTSIGKNILMITHPLYADYVDEIVIKNATTNINTIKLIDKSKLLEAIIIKSGGAIKIKGDTTIYTADSFNVSANANVEELLKKLPGIQVDKNGEIKAMGEKVEKVLVDGEEFFGDDPGMAVKNIRADAVKEVQVFDKKSDQAAFTGIDDGNTKKTINLKLKEDRKKGYFGKINTSGGIGNDITNRFNNNVMFGSFKGKRKISAFVLNGNTGQDGLSWQESQKYGGEEMNFEMTDEDGIFNMSMLSGNNDEEININTENGFIRNINAGIQYSNKWNDIHKINISPKYNLQDYSNSSSVNMITQLGDSILKEQSSVNKYVNRYNFKNSVVYDYKLNNKNTLKITIKENYFNSKSIESTLAETINKDGNVKNNSTRKSDIKSEKTTLYGNILFNHKFEKSRRTISINLDINNMKNGIDNFLASKNTFFEENSPISISIDQFRRTDKSNNKLSSKLIYTEPINKYWSMELGYEFSANQSLNNQSTFVKPLSTDIYNQLLDSLTNDFNQNIVINTPSAKFNYSFKKYKFNVGSGFGITHFDLLDKSINKNYVRKYTNLFPSASFVYSYKSNHSFRIKYNGYNTQPTINQLQPLRNNTNVFNQFNGNLNLKPSFANNINFTNNGYNFLKNIWNYQSLNITLNKDAITYNKIIDPISGATLSTPINTNGNINVAFWSGIGFKHKKTDIDIQISPTANVSRFVDVINNKSSYANTYSGGLSLNLNKSKKDKYDFTLNNDYALSYNKNNQTINTNKFANNTLGLTTTLYYKKVWSLISEYQYFWRQKITDASSALNNQFWNIQLQRTFKNNEFTAYFKARDVLNQNIGIDRSYYGNTFTENKDQRLKRYFMIGFSWDFKNKNYSSKK